MLIKIGITKNFYKQLEQSDNNTKKRIHKIFTMIENDQLTPGMHTEPLITAGNWWSIRLSDSDRALFIKNSNLSGTTYIFHTFGPHKIEEKIDIKESKIFKEGVKNIFEGILENVQNFLFENQEAYNENKKIIKIKSEFEQTAKDEKYKIFIKYFSDICKLFDIQINNEMKFKIGKANNEDEVLECIVNFEIEELLKLYENENFYIFDNKEDLDRLSEGELKDWMLFLNTKQIDIVKQSFSGPARIRGVVGSGKTTVALHRTKYLLRKYNESDEKILFLTFNRILNKTIDELENILINNEDDFNRVEITTLHSWALNFIKNLIDRTLPNSKELDEILKQAINEVPDARKFKFDDIKNEILYFVKGNGINRLEDYLNFKRRGGHDALKEKNRRILFEIYKKYEELLNNKKLLDFNDCVIKAIEIINKKEKIPYRYTAIIVDEIQDLKKIDMMLIKKLSEYMKWGDGNLLLVGDYQQKIYRSVFSFKDVEINIVGRSKILMKNYRNTKEIFMLGKEIVKNIKSFIETFIEREEYEEINNDYSLFNRSGEIPELWQYKTWEELKEHIAQTIKQEVETKHCYNYGDFAIILRLKEHAKEIMKVFSTKNIPCDFLSPEYHSLNILDKNKVKILTMHSSKGIEFKNVYIIGAAQHIIPLRSEQSSQEGLLRERILLYVAITRAINKVKLCYSKEYKGEFYKESEFLNEIPETLLKRIKYKG